MKVERNIELELRPIKAVYPTLRIKSVSLILVMPMDGKGDESFEICYTFTENQDCEQESKP